MLHFSHRREFFRIRFADSATWSSTLTKDVQQGGIWGSGFVPKLELSISASLEWPSSVSTILLFLPIRLNLKIYLPTDYHNLLLSTRCSHRFIGSRSGEVDLNFVSLYNDARVTLTNASTGSGAVICKCRLDWHVGERVIMRHFFTVPVSKLRTATYAQYPGPVRCH